MLIDQVWEWVGRMGGGSEMARRTIFLLLVATVLSCSVWALDEDQEQIATQLEELMGFDEPVLLDEPLMPVVLLAELYASREFEPIWEADERVAQLLEMARLSETRASTRMTTTSRNSSN